MKTSPSPKPTFRAALEAFLSARWYGRAGILWLLTPFEWLYSALAEQRRMRALRELDSALSRKTKGTGAPPHIPTIVVGNLVAGGTGKTPIVAEVVRELLALGARPGIITRGYGGTAKSWPRLVTAQHNPELCGDEAVELAMLTNCPVVAAPDRTAAARWLVELLGCNVVVSDDGLQHYKLARDLEIVLVDGERGFGNGHRLPVGPLRELPERMRRADIAIITARSIDEITLIPATLDKTLEKTLTGTDVRVWRCLLVPDSARPLIASKVDDETSDNTMDRAANTGNTTSVLNDAVPVADAPFVGASVVALSSIAAPQRFHADLMALGCGLSRRVLADHQSYKNFVPDWPQQRWVVTTGKDAVKLAWSLKSSAGQRPDQGAGKVARWQEQVWVIQRRVQFSGADAGQFSQALAGFVGKWQLAELSPAVDNLASTALLETTQEQNS